jgi:tetratricopeptide (TPR) repeat protein
MVELNFDTPVEDVRATLPPLSAAPTLAAIPGPPDATAADWDTVLSDEHEREEALVSEAEDAIAHNNFGLAVAALAKVHVSPLSFPDLALRSLLAESWAQMSLGAIDDAARLLERAQTIVGQPSFSESDRAEVFYRLGCCRFSSSAYGEAVSLFTLALAHCERSDTACDGLRARIYESRAVCHQGHSDWDAARADVERALTLAERIGDEETVAYGYSQASLIAERESQWLLARFYAEAARVTYEQLGDRVNLQKVLDNLGRINEVLGETAHAVACLEEAYQLALELGENLAAARAKSSLAEVHLKSGNPEQAEDLARRALERLACEPDRHEENGKAQLLLGRALLDQDRDAEAAQRFNCAAARFERLESPRHRASALLAQGDLWATRGDSDTAAMLYRQAAQALQDAS